MKGAGDVVEAAGLVGDGVGGLVRRQIGESGPLLPGHAQHLGAVVGRVLWEREDTLRLLLGQYPRDAALQVETDFLLCSLTVQRCRKEREGRVPAQVLSVHGLSEMMVVPGSARRVQASVR